MECNFCKSELKSVSSLNYHKKNNKKCLEIQNNIFETSDSSLVLCKFCEKHFCNINRHYLTCKTKTNKDFEILKLDNEKKQIEITELKEYITKLEAENSIYKRDHETLTSIAKQPKISTTNNTSNTYNLSVYDDNLIKDRFMIAINNIKPSDIYEGQKSIGRFVAPCLKNDDGTSMISCTDSSRNVFIYKDSDGNINKDIKCKNLANLIEPIASAKVDELIKEDTDKRYKEKKMVELRNDIVKRQNEIISLENHLVGLVRDSKPWFHAKNQIIKKENENERDIEELEGLQNNEIELVINPYVYVDCDEKLVVAADEIKEMKKDSCKFSKTISEQLV